MNLNIFERRVKRIEASQKRAPQTVRNFASHGGNPIPYPERAQNERV